MRGRCPMKIISSALVSSLVICYPIVFFGFLILGLYALHVKGDVKFAVSRKPLKITIECKEKRSEKHRPSGP
jgi:hypothetical protein